MLVLLGRYKRNHVRQQKHPFVTYLAGDKYISCPESPQVHGKEREPE